jgi:hypothetical protein
MITETRENVVERFGVRSESQFKIKATGKAFRILSDGLYSDKVRAIIRELSCNAYDSHVAAGKSDVPFDIQLPNKLDPVFRIRDYGTGLKNRDIKTIYTTYFESTKTSSNDYVGCLGLGSKSPFSYTQSFTITSYYNGFKRIYSAFLNEDDTPSIVLLGRCKTDELNGLEISFSVNFNDFSTFYSKASYVLSYFPVTPNISGYDIEIKNMLNDGYMMQGKGWGLRHGNGTSMAIMGNVCYPLYDFVNVCELSDSQNKLLRIPVDIYFNIGELEVSASRESLSFKKSLNHVIVSRLDSILEDIRSKINDEVSSCSNLWSARIMIYELVKGGYSVLKSILDGHQFEWGGEKLTANNYIEVIGVNIVNYKYKEFYSRRSCCYSRKINKSNTNIIRASKNSILYWNDGVRCVDRRCKQMAAELSTDKEIYFINCDASRLSEVNDILGGAEINPVSSIELDKTKRSTNINPLNNAKVLIYDASNSVHNVASSYWKKEDIDITDSGVYVVIDRYRIHDNAPDSYIDSMVDRLRIINEKIDFDIVGVRWKYVDKLKENNWVSLENYVKNLYAKYFEKNKLIDFIHAHKAKDMIRRSFGHYDTFLKLESDNVLLNEFKDLYNEVYSLSQSHNNYEALYYNANIFNINIDIENNKFYKSLEIMLQSLYERYPLIKAIDFYRMEGLMDSINDYVRGIDALEEINELKEKVA